MPGYLELAMKSIRSRQQHLSDDEMRDAYLAACDDLCSVWTLGIDAFVRENYPGLHASSNKEGLLNTVALGQNGISTRGFPRQIASAASFQQPPEGCGSRGLSGPACQ